jgi:hypothetical protein
MSQSVMIKYQISHGFTMNKKGEIRKKGWLSQNNNIVTIREGEHDDSQKYTSIFVDFAEMLIPKSGTGQMSGMHATGRYDQ